MSKNIMTSGIEMEDVIKPTGFPVPEDMVGKTFAEVVEGGGSGDITVEALTATENKVYTAPSGKAYSPVTVNVPSADIEANKEATIDVSQYSAPVEITPTVGKDGMAKATVTLSNIPSGGSTTLYCWTNLYDGKTSYVYHNFSTAPENTDNWKMLTLASIGDESNIGELALDDWEGWYGSGYTYTKDSDTQFTISDDSGNYVYTRAVAKDFTLWG